MLGIDILKILYASEDEKVTVSEDGKLIIAAPGGDGAEFVSDGKEPAHDAGAPAHDENLAGDDDQLME